MEYKKLYEVDEDGIVSGTVILEGRGVIIVWVVIYCVIPDLFFHCHSHLFTAPHQIYI